MPPCRDLCKYIGKLYLPSKNEKLAAPDLQAALEGQDLCHTVSIEIHYSSQDKSAQSSLAGSDSKF